MRFLAYWPETVFLIKRYCILIPWIDFKDGTLTAFLLPIIQHEIQCIPTIVMVTKLRSYVQFTNFQIGPFNTRRNKSYPLTIDHDICKEVAVLHIMTNFIWTDPIIEYPLCTFPPTRHYRGISIDPDGTNVL